VGVKRAFKLRKHFEIDRRYLEVFLGKPINDDVFLVLDKDTDAIQLITHVCGKKEYLVLIPGKPSFIILNLSKDCSELLIKALRVLSQSVNISDEVIEEIDILIDLYLSLDVIAKGKLKLKTKEIVEYLTPILSQIDDRIILENMIPYLVKGITKAAIRKLFTPDYFSNKVINAFTLDELYDIFEQEILTQEVENYVLRLLKTKLLVQKDERST